MPKARKPVGQTPPEELERRILLVADLLAQGVRKGEIKRRVREQIADVSHVTIERYISRAREILRDDILATTEEHLAESIAYYRGVLADPKARVDQRLAARARMDRLLGLEHLATQRVQVQVSGPDGQPVQVAHELPAEVMDAVRAFTVSRQTEVDRGE